MANREKGEASVEINGVSYTLALNINAMCEVETMLSIGGKDVRFLDVFHRACAGHLVSLRAVFWGALRQHHGQVTLRAAGDLLNEFGEAELTQQLASLTPHVTPHPEDVATISEGQANVRPLKAQERKSGMAAGIGKPSSGMRSVPA